MKNTCSDEIQDCLQGRLECGDLPGNEIPEMDFYYKTSDNKYYGINILTKDEGFTDQILDQINVAGGIFCTHQEFHKNINNPMTLSIMDSPTESIEVAEICFEGIDLGEVDKEGQVII